MNIPRRLWRVRWHGLLLAWGVAIVGWGTIAMQPGRYAATAQIYANTGSSIEIHVGRIEPGEVVFTVSDMVGRSSIERQQLDDVIRAAGPISATGSGGDMERAVNRLLDRIEIRTSTKWGNLFLISYSDRSQRNALAVVESFVGMIAQDAQRAIQTRENEGPADRDKQAADDFRIVDPPAASQMAWPPNRPAWILLVLLVGLSSGIGLADWLSRRNPVFDTAEQIAAIAGAPVAGVVAHARMAQANAQRRRDSMIFGAATAALIVCFAIMLLV